MALSPYHLTPEELLSDVRWLQRFARSLVQDEARADELAQDAWLKAVERAEAHPPGALRAWLAQVVRNLVARHWRDSDLQRNYESRAASERPSSVGADREIERLELQRQLVVAVLDLEEPYRTTILLHHLRELPYAEVARRLGVEEATVRKRNSRGLTLLRERLARELEGEDNAHRALAGLAGLRARPARWPAPLTLAALAGGLLFLLLSRTEASPPYFPAATTPADARAELARLEPWILRWDALACPLSPELARAAPGLTLRWLERRSDGARLLQRSEALLGWDPVQDAFVYLQFSEEMPAYETTAEGRLELDAEGRLTRFYDVYEPDRSVRTHRERFTRLPDGGCRRLFEEAREDGAWTWILEPELVPHVAREGELDPARPGPAVEAGMEHRRTTLDQEALAALDFLAGSWRIETEPEARLELAFGRSRRFLELTWREAGEIRAHGTIGWHHGQGELVFQRFRPGWMERGSARASGRELTLEGEAWTSAERRSLRERWRLTPGGDLELVLELREGAGEWREHARRLARRVRA